MQIIYLKRLLAAALALNKEEFVIYVTYLESKILISLAWKAQIASLLAKKVSVFKEYFDFSNVFFKKFEAILFNFLDINNDAIDL